MSVDVRTREDGATPPFDAHRFFAETLPAALEWLWRGYPAE